MRWGGFLNRVCLSFLLTEEGEVGLQSKGDDVLGNFSILGTAAIAGFAEYSFLTSDFSFYEPQNKRWNGGEYSSTSSCGSGDGGGGCGGGGCGGCGS